MSLTSIFSTKAGLFRSAKQSILHKSPHPLLFLSQSSQACASPQGSQVPKGPPRPLGPAPERRSTTQREHLRPKGAPPWSRRSSKGRKSRALIESPKPSAPPRVRHNSSLKSSATPSRLQCGRILSAAPADLRQGSQSLLSSVKCAPNSAKPDVPNLSPL